MSKKPKTPPPPRAVQAPQRRDGKGGGKPPKQPGSTGPGVGPLGSRGRPFMYKVAGVAVLAIVGAVVGAILASGGSASLASALKSAGCSFQTVDAYVPKGQGTHVASLTAKLKWNTDPPSNGQHYPEWAVWGFYTTPINPRKVIHNEEHGGVVLWWGSQVPGSTVEKLRALYDENPIGMFGTPYPALGNKVAITAWTGDPSRYQHKGYYGQGHIAVCGTYTDATAKAFAKFRDAYVGNGPEGIPLTQDVPGAGPGGFMNPTTTTP